MNSTLYTVGHSNRTIEEFFALLQAHGIERLVDVRTIPKSRHNPQFNRDTLPGSLSAHGIGYEHRKGLGGLRHTTKDSPNQGWRNASFRGYADYMQTDEFAGEIEALAELARSERIAIMCAEAVPWRCHRSLIGDAMRVRGFKVLDIMNEKTEREHKLTRFAQVEGTRITYPFALEG
ncbi:MAG: DUF488 domain-containing protein [Gammaproteobacteria bacterium]|nr:DUF488 domain-containing protein [Gammaproteobacteria bacterium]